MSKVKNGKEMTQEFVNLAMYLVFAAWGLNLGTSVLITGNNIYEKIKSCIDKKKNVAKIQSDNIKTSKSNQETVKIGI